MDEFDTYEHEDPGLTNHFIIIILMVFCVILVGVLSLIVTLLFHKRKKKYMYPTGRCVMTFSNPNYCTSNPEAAAPAGGDKKPFSWKRLKYDKAQVSFTFFL